MTEKIDDIHFYAEWVPFKNDDEKEKAKLYLNLWIHFFLEKNCFELVEGPQITEKNLSATANTLGAKIAVKLKT